MHRNPIVHVKDEYKLTGVCSCLVIFLPSVMFSLVTSICWFFAFSRNCLTTEFFIAAVMATLMSDIAKCRVTDTEMPDQC